MKILFIGGTGIISSACTPEALKRGHEVTLLNRGREGRRALPAGARVLQGDIRDPQSVRDALNGEKFDVVVDWIAYKPEHVEADLKLFNGSVGQYVFISSASVYQKPPAALPITESTPLYNPFWEYSQDKIACEERLNRAYRETGFPVTIVRPSHTYDRTLLPMNGGYTIVNRMRQGKKVVVHGDGASLWVMTHHEDFARAFVALLGNPHAIGDAVQITSDELLTWNGIFRTVGRAAGVEPNIVHIPSDTIARFLPDLGPGLLGDKSHSVIFDNTKIKRLAPGWTATIPFAQGAREIMTWYDAHPEAQTVDKTLDAGMDRLIAAWEKIA